MDTSYPWTFQERLNSLDAVGPVLRFREETVAMSRVGVSSSTKSKISDDEEENPRPSEQTFTSFFMKDILGLEVKEKTVELVIDREHEEQLTSKNVVIAVKETCLTSGEDCSSKPKEDIFKVKSRSPFLDKQRMALEKRFKVSKYISLEERKTFAAELLLTERQVKTWFQNRRTKWRKVRGNEGLTRAKSPENREKTNTAKILSNSTDKLPPKLISELHKQLTTQESQ